MTRQVFEEKKKKITDKVFLGESLKCIVHAEQNVVSLRRTLLPKIGLLISKTTAPPQVLF